MLFLVNPNILMPRQDLALADNYSLDLDVMVSALYLVSLSPSQGNDALSLFINLV